MSKNIVGNKLKKCQSNSKTGWHRDNYCSYNKQDGGRHIVCASVTKDFLQFTYSKGNDLITPRGDFPGLVPGDRWCLCVHRWIESYKAGVAPPIYLESSDIEVLKYVDIEILKKYALRV